MLPFTPSLCCEFHLISPCCAHDHRCRTRVPTDAAPPGQPSAVYRCPFVSSVALLAWRDLLFCAKHLFVAARTVGMGCRERDRARPRGRLAAIGRNAVDDLKSSLQSLDAIC